MTIFLTLFANLVPLYMIIALGFVAGRYFGVDRNTLANLALFILVPVVMFGFILQMEFKPAYLLLPVLVYGVQVMMGFGGLAIGRKMFGGTKAHIFAMLCSMGNTGYFGLPLALLLFDQNEVAIYIFMTISGVMYEATVGYYIAARGHFSVQESLRKLAKFPMLYALVLAFIVKESGIVMPEQFFTYWTYFKGAYVVVGMMILGAALGNIEKLVVDVKFIASVFVGKFLIWPALICGVIALDKAVFHLFSGPLYSLLLVNAIVPPAANVAAFASQLNLNPEKAATTILLGTVLALVSIPLMLMWAGIS